MVQPAKRFDVWRRLYNRFLIEPFPAGEGDTPGVATTIFPVTDADKLLSVQVSATATNNLTAGAGTYVPYFTVPTGKRWRVKNFMRFGTTAVSAILVLVSGSAAVHLNQQVVAGQELVLDLPLDENGSMGLITTGDAGDGAVRADIVYEEEDAF